MRTKIEVFQMPPEGKYKFEYKVQMLTGPYGRYEEVLTGKAVNEDRAFETAESEAQRYLFERNRRTPVARKYINVEAKA